MRTVQQIADRVGLPARTVRYYDRIGLVEAGSRTESGYRLYRPEDEGRLRFVKQARGLGLSLAEIRVLIDAAEEGCCEGVRSELDRLLVDKIAELGERIAELGTFRQRLIDFRDGSGSSCGCTGHAAFCECFADAPQLVQLTRGGKR